MLDREKLRRKLDRQTASDHTRMRHWYERREGRIVKGLENPALPAFCRICLIGMLAGAAMAASADIVSAYRRGSLNASALQSAALSALALWLVFGLGLGAGCAIQLKRGFDHPWFEAHSLRHSGKRRMPWDRKYRLWLTIAVVGAAALTGLYAIMSML